MPYDTSSDTEVNATVDTSTNGAKTAESRTRGRPRKPTRTKAAFDAKVHGETIAAIKSIPENRRNAVRDKAISRVTRSDASPSHKVIFNRLAMEIWWEDGRFLRSNAWLAKECGTSTRTTERAVEVLRDVGWISRRERMTEAGDHQTAETTIPLFSQVWREMQGGADRKIEGVPTEKSEPRNFLSGGTDTSGGQPSDSPSDSPREKENSAPSERRAKARAMDDFWKSRAEELDIDPGDALFQEVKRQAQAGEVHPLGILRDILVPDSILGKWMGTPERRKQHKAEKLAAQRAEAMSAMEIYNAAAKHFGFGPCKAITEARLQKLEKRLAEIGGVEVFEKALWAVDRDDFLMGRISKPGQRPFKLTFERLMSTGSGLGDVLARLVDKIDVPQEPEAVRTGKSKLRPDWWRGKESVLPKFEPEFWRYILAQYANGTWPVEYLGPGPWDERCLVPLALMTELELRTKYPDDPNGAVPRAAAQPDKPTMRKPTPVAQPKTKRETKHRTRLEPDWRPALEDVVWVQERFVATPIQVGAQAERFRDHHRAKGNAMADWSAAWHTWWNNGYHKIARRLEAPAPLLDVPVSRVRSVSQQQFDAEMAAIDGALR